MILQNQQKDVTSVHYMKIWVMPYVWLADSNTKNILHHLLILEHFNNHDEYEILCYDGNFSSSFSCRIHSIVWIIMI